MQMLLVVTRFADVLEVVPVERDVRVRDVHRIEILRVVHDVAEVLVTSLTQPAVDRDAVRYERGPDFLPGR